MIAFADSSAVVKLYADETGSDAVSRLDVMVVSALARVEVPAVLWRKHRTGELTQTDAATLVAAFQADVVDPDQHPRLAAVPVTSAVIDQAARVVGVHGLRAYDGVQLASALTVRDVVPDVATFAAFDDDLRAAALREGLALLPA